MNISVNGENVDTEKSSLTITELLRIRKVEKPEMLSIQLNSKFVDKKNYDSTFVKENDEVDFLYFMGGGFSR